MFFIKSEFRWWESKMFHLMMDQRSRLFLLLLFYLLINLVHLGLYQSYFSLRRRKRRRRRSNMRLLKFPIFRLVVTIKLGFLSEELAIAHSETYLDSSVRFIAYYKNQSTDQTIMVKKYSFLWSVFKHNRLTFYAILM